MAEADDVNEVRRITLERIERTERHYKTAFYAAAALEGLFLVGFLLLMDFGNRTHTLLLIATVAGYTIVVLGLVALGAHVNRHSLRLLKAIELLARQLADGKK